VYATKTAFTLVLLLTAQALPTSAQSGVAGKHDPVVEARLRADFARFDLNKDGFLDANELARAFRGPTAKAPPVLEYDDMGNIKSGTGLDRKLADQTYLYALDKDFDSQISWAEFDEYGEAYAAALRGQQLDQQRQQALYLQAQRNFASSQFRRATYSRSGYNRGSSYRSIRRPGTNSASQAHRIADQRHLVQDRMRQQQEYQRRLVQEQQRRMVLQQQQQQRILTQQRAVYSRQMPPVHRAVKTPPRIQQHR
jgi:hypothetical protein